MDSYEGDCLQASVVDELLENGVNSTAFRSLITWITNELGGLLDLDEQVIKTKKKLDNPFNMNVKLLLLHQINRYIQTVRSQTLHWNCPAS